MFSTFKSIKKRLFAIGGLLVLLSLIAFTEIKHRQKRVQAVVIHIDQIDGHSFLTRKDVTGYLTNEGADPVIGKVYKELNFHQLEERLRRHGLVNSCQISRDLTGDLLVTVEQPRPLARLIASGDGVQTVAGQYVSEEGRFFPISMNYSARVPVLTGDYFVKNRSLASERNRPLLELLKRIRDDPFWRAQITEVSVDGQGEVRMWPQMGNHQIELGTPTDLEAKFKKLKLFYTDVLPAKGWDRYSRVNVQYRNQIVCE
ncbi:cell division protein FtsQ/DivIB [Spirosoma sp. RP8]|uniref:Cell division protein FtsQ/DivIB n=1 Tax=Spirosoma liriopis TaxID=2937440 RepID=A0ABT0HHM4_9BACT|nr:cell division protein FtsQ/DivIB [Spirosoma liriopis]MCK8491500.1 cell division protein FtsQ/DivIB [Spirosoma liriopis]